MNYRKTLTFLTLVILTIVITAAQISPTQKFKNLKVLPQDISEKKLDSIMHAYNKALKVSCDFCHTPVKDSTGINLATDNTNFSLDNSMKENARRMMRLTIDLNKTYFYFDSTIRPEYLNVVSCNTCHRGNPFPVNE